MDIKCFATKCSIHKNLISAIAESADEKYIEKFAVAHLARCNGPLVVLGHPIQAQEMASIYYGDIQRVVERNESYC